GLEQGISLVMAKAVLGLLDAGVPVAEIMRTGVGFGTRYRQGGWGAGLTVLTAMANVLPRLDPADRSRALVAGLAFVSRDTRGRRRHRGPAGDGGPAGFGRPQRGAGRLALPPRPGRDDRRGQRPAAGAAGGRVGLRRPLRRRRGRGGRRRGPPGLVDPVRRP